MKTGTTFRAIVGGAVALLALGAVALAVQPGTTGTNKANQQQGFRTAVLIQKTNTATATSGAATLNQAGSGIITSETLTTAAGVVYTLTLTNDMIAAADVVLASVQYGTSTAGSPAVTRVTPAAGSVVILVQNVHASAALDGTIKIGFLVIKQSALGAD